MLRALQQRRQQSVADNYQIKLDQDSFNENHNDGELIQMVFNYEEDLRELEEAASAVRIVS